MSTTTPTDDLAAALSARRAEIAATPADPIDAEVVDQTTGEIVSVAAGTGSTPVPAAPAPPAEAPTVYPAVPPKVLGGLPYIRDYVKLARTIDQTEMVPAAFRGRYDAITAAFMRGHEMGLGPMQALDSFNVIQGRVGLTSEAMRALILNAGHDIILTEHTDDAGKVTAVTAECHRSSWPADKWASYTYTMQDAALAGLLGKSTWKQQPRAMLDARATSGAGRRYFADVLAGMSYTPEEIRDFSGREQEEPTSRPTPPPPPAPVPEDSSATVSDPQPTADSTDSAPATSPAPEDAQPTEPPAKRTRARKASEPKHAAAPKAPAGDSQGAATAPAPAADPSPAGDAPTLALEPPEETSLNTNGDTPAIAGPGEGAVVVQMRQALTEIIKGLPAIQQPLVRSFLREHFPNGIDTLDADGIQKAIDIAVGWPDSADQHPIPGQDEQFPF
jgi:hypothetical protein